MSIATELQKIRQSKSAIKAAITEKIKEDAGDNLSTYADKIASIKSGGFDFISESRDYNFTNDNPHPTVNITTQNNEAYFIYDNRDRKAWYGIKVTCATSTILTAEIGHLDINGEYVYDATVNTNLKYNNTVNGLFDLDYDYTVLKISGLLTIFNTNHSAAINGKSILTSQMPMQPMIECIIDLPSYIGYGTRGTPTATPNQLSYHLKKFTMKNCKPKDLCNLCAGCAKLEEFNVVNCDFSQLKSLHGIFAYCKSLKSFDFSNWNITNALEDGGYMFTQCNSLESVNLNGIGKINATLAYAFQYCYSLKELDLSVVDTSNVTNLYSTFQACHSLVNLDLSKNTFGKIAQLYNTFSGCYSLKTLKLPELDLSDCTTVVALFQYCSNLIFDDDLLGKISRWNISTKCNTVSGMFGSAYNLQKIDISKWDLSGITTFNGMFGNCYSLLDVKFPTTDIKANVLTYMFQNCYSLRSVDLSGFNMTVPCSMDNSFSACYSLKKVKLPQNLKTATMAATFNNCRSLETIENLYTIDTTNCVSFNSTFNNCNTLKSIDLSNFTITDKCTNMGSMFRYCFNLEEVVFNPDLAHNTSKVTSIEYFINQCYNLKKFEFKIPLQNITSARELAQEDFNLKYIDTLISLDKITSYPPTYSNCVSLEYANYSSQPTIAYNLSTAPNLSREYLLDVINKLPTLSAAKTLTLGQHRLKLTDAELQVAINKNWTIA